MVCQLYWIKPLARHTLLGAIAFMMWLVSGLSMSTELPYRVVGDKVDRSTYLGWRVFHSVCYGCHGVDATGTTVAPNLVERVREMTPRQFTTKVLTRYRITLGYDDAAADNTTALREAFIEQVLRHQRGELIMPAWQQDQNVTPHILDLYAYLSARADGALGEGRPEQIPE